MSVPEYVFMHRIKEFYDELRSGRNLWKVDETLGFVDEKSRTMIKRWIQDPRFEWTFGKGYSVLQKEAPIISLVVDADADRNYMLGNYASDGIIMDADAVTPQMYYAENARFKSGTFLIVMTAPNADMLTAMYCLVERALYEGESANLGEEHIIQFNDYNISELRYSGTDVRPDQNYIPLNTWARTLKINCTYIHTWQGRIYSKNGYAFTVDLGNIYAGDDLLQKNPEFIEGYPVLPTSQSQTYTPTPGVTLTASTVGTTPVAFTADGQFPAADNILVVPANSTLVFDAAIGANINGTASAFWKFGGVVRRANALSSTTLVGITAYEVVADALFSSTYIDIDVDQSLGALKIQATGLPETSIDWSASVQFKELS